MPNFQLVNIYRYTYFKIVSISYLKKKKQNTKRLLIIITKKRNILLKKLECQEREEERKKNIIYLSTSTTTYLKKVSNNFKMINKLDCKTLSPIYKKLKILTKNIKTKIKEEETYIYIKTCQIVYTRINNQNNQTEFLNSNIYLKGNQKKNIKIPLPFSNDRHCNTQKYIITVL